MSLKIEKRFKKATKEACDLAKDEAVLQKHPKVTSLHVLVGLFLQNGEAAKILKSEGVTLEKLRRQLEKYNTRFDKVTKDPGYVPRVIRVFSYSLSEAANDSSEDLTLKAISTEHLLRGLLRDSGGTAAHALHQVGVTPGDLYLKLAPKTDAVTV